MVDYSVLIIDDDIWMQRILTKTLQSYGFKDVFMSSNGFEGIALAVEHRPTLIILDILMPELSGHLTLKILKHIKYTKDIPVLMVSALSDIENLGLAVKSGTAGFISKPFTRATVYDKLVSIFGKDELELIMRGEPISGLEARPHREGWPDEESGVSNFSDSEQSDANQKDSFQATKKKVTQDQLLSHYQDDEKRSIESIKKLLLKTK
jgi:CheY-like chemotaxis protein